MDIYITSLKAICYILVVVKVFGGIELTKPSAFDCYGDVCNLEYEHQFCSETFKYCRNCEDVRHDCGSSSQPTACNRYCIDTAVIEALEKVKGKETCSVSYMMSIANGVVNTTLANNSVLSLGSSLTYICNEGYTLQGPTSMMCTGYETWDQPEMPYCLDDTCFHYKTATIILSVFAAVCFLGSLMSIVCHRRSLQKFKSKCVSLSKENPLHIEESRPLVGLIQRIADEKSPSTKPVSALVKECVDNGIHPRVSNTATTPSAPPTEPPVIDEMEHMHKNNYSSQTQKVSNLNITIQNDVQINNLPSVLPEGNEKKSEQNRRISSQGASYRIYDDKMPTEESGEISPCEETDLEKKDKGTKPLPAREDEYKPSMKKLKDIEIEGPEVLPAEDVDSKIPLSTDETSQGEILKKLGFQDVTFAKNDI